MLQTAPDHILSSSPTLPTRPAGDYHQRLWEEYRQTQDPMVRQKLASLYLHLVQSLAAQVASGLPACVDVNDLVQEGFFGLYRAIGKFDITYDVKFTTYASSAIRGAMLDSLRRSAWAPRGARQRAHELEQARTELFQELDRPPTEDELAAHLGIELDDYRRMAEDARIATQESMWTSEGTDPSESRVRDTLPADDRTPDPAMEAQRGDLRGLLLRGFDPMERLIVILYYFEEMTMKEIGATLGISESRVSQKHSLIRERIKSVMDGHRKEFES